jgi:hypothetical protein
MWGVEGIHQQLKYVQVTATQVRRLEVKIGHHEPGQFIFSRTAWNEHVMQKSHVWSCLTCFLVSEVVLLISINFSAVTVRRESWH